MSVEPQQGLVSQVQICPNPIFVIGAPRSGTSILAWSLAQHSRLWTSSESFILSYFFQDGWLDQSFQKAKQIPKNWFELQGVEKSEFIRSLGLGFNALFTSRSQGKRWIDQTPGYTVLVDDLAEMFPGALFIHILRDGRRVVHSMMNFLNSLSDEHKAALVKSGSAMGRQTFREACQAWWHYVEVAMDFCARHPTRCLTVVNEQLVANPDDCFREVLQFLEVPYEAAPADYFRTHRINSSFRPDSTDRRWVQQLSEPWQQWTPEQATIFWFEAGTTLVRYGLARAEEANSPDILALGQEQRQLQQNYKELERWAHELETTARQQEATIQMYQRRLAPTLWLRRLLHSLRHSQTKAL